MSGAPYSSERAPFVRSPVNRAVRVFAAVALLFAGLLLAPAQATAAPGPLGEQDFTLMLIPDTQNYVKSEGDHQIFGQQTQWIVDHRADLKLAFVSHLGDIVDTWTDGTQWARASQYMATLDAAGVPNGVLPGNHDMSSTGQIFRYNDNFPVTRYSNASWNSPSARYGGHLGQNQFGPDPVNRQNMDNYALVDAGGLRFLILHLEFEAPDYVLDWAKRVVNAHPDRRVVVATHSYLHTGGARSQTLVRTDPGVNTGEQIWNEFIYETCNIFLVVNGHYHDGELSEARRTDNNACGKPVHQILSDYQDRARGGNGWLRYYIFRPTQSAIEAVTYSPLLDQFETDADSSFTLPYEMSESPTEERIFVGGASSWRWQYRNAAWPVNWNGLNFDDSAWQSGGAALGFGTSSVRTNIDVPPPTSNRPRSAQFRTSFTIEDASAVRQASLLTRADDGVVVYVNGTEIGRAGLPAGTLTANSYATAAPRTAAATGSPARFDIPTGVLVDGLNVVAASTHLNYRATPDVSFDAVVTGIVAQQPPSPPAAPSVTAELSGPDAVTLNWTSDPAVQVSSARIERNGVALTEVAAPTSTYRDTGLEAETTYTYRVFSVGTSGLVSEPTERVITTPPATQEERVFVAPGASWRWQYLNAPWPAGWTSAQFDDASWRQGNAALGFGTSALNTNIDVPPPTSNRPRSAQFRHTFTIADAAKVSDITLTTRADDGVVVYVNGVEVGRNRMPSGSLTSVSYATAAPRTATAIASPVVLEVPTALLVSGQNVIAVSSHLNYRATPDLTFDLQLTGKVRP